ncbi:MAG: rhomboid family intramembrane serine protease [Rhizonema sp. PD38]|nr:rhomboid family intramembrane serine protease [Rhizonema sp. PD38]
MIPISDNIVSRGKPRVIYWLIGINLALFFWELKLENNGELSSVVNSWGVIPALFNDAIANALSGNPAAWIVVLWRSTSLLLGMFLNRSFSQILGNLIFLWVFGKNVENILGHKLFLVFYLCSGIFTGLFQIITEPSSSLPFVGANGAIASVLGAYLFKFPKAKIDTILPLLILYIPVELPAFFHVCWWFVQQSFYGIGSLNISGGNNPSSIGYGAQVAGLLVGAALMRLVQQFKRSPTS